MVCRSLADGLGAGDAVTDAASGWRAPRLTGPHDEAHQATRLVPCRRAGLRLAPHLCAPGAAA